MTNDSDADSTAIDRTGDDHPGGAKGNGPTNIPEETVSSESDLRLDNQTGGNDTDSKPNSE